MQEAEPLLISVVSQAAQNRTMPRAMDLPQGALVHTATFVPKEVQQAQSQYGGSGEKGKILQVAITQLRTAPEGYPGMVRYVTLCLGGPATHVRFPFETLDTTSSMQILNEALMSQMRQIPAATVREYRWYPSMSQVLP